MTGDFKPHAVPLPIALTRAHSAGRGSLHLQPSHPVQGHEAGRAPLDLPLPGLDGTRRQTDGPLGARGVAGGTAACPSRSQHALWEEQEG